MIITQIGGVQPPKVVVTISDTTNGKLHEVNIAQCTFGDLVADLKEHGLVNGNVAGVKVLLDAKARIGGHYILQNGDFIELVAALDNGVPSAPVYAVLRELFDMLAIDIDDCAIIDIVKNRLGTRLSYTSDRDSDRPLPADVAIVRQLYKLLQALGVPQSEKCDIYIEKNDEDTVYITFD
jgi:hypothetical protein